MSENRDAERGSVCVVLGGTSEPEREDVPEGVASERVEGERNAGTPHPE